MTIRLTRAPLASARGIVAQTFWQLPGVLRSDSPHAFAAAGPQAARITAPHPVDVPHGLTARLAGYMNWMGRCAARRGSHRQYYHPPGRVYETRPLPAQKYVTLLKEGRLSRVRLH